MNSQNRFLGKAEYLEIEGIGQVPILAMRPLELILFKDDAKPEERVSANEEIMKRCCAESKINDEGKIVRVPFFNDEELKEMPLPIFEKIMDKILEISGLKEKHDEAKKRYFESKEKDREQGSK